ncbi:MAG: Npun_F5749 family FMN-dependent PPOX-type flavoprotein [Cyanobacteria bacterium J06627_28]
MPPAASPFELAPWRSPLSRALHRNRAQPFCRFLQLATLRADGTPANRTLVFRGFLAESNQLIMISDRRSEKIQQIQQNPNAEACWYFTKTREQFRLNGLLTVVMAPHSDESSAHASSAQSPKNPKEFIQARQKTWQSISDKARLQFAWPTPKAPRTEDANFQPDTPDAVNPPDDFCLLLLKPHTVDHLALRGDPQTRILYEKLAEEKLAEEKLAETAASEHPAERWSVNEVNP